jgi:Protein of unknown function (DUF3306)
MSDDNFLGRWSRLKREAAQPPKPETAPPDEHAAAAPTNDVAPVVPTTETTDVPFDPASLPPIESIDALSDIRDFLAPGVPPALTHAALRRAWIADPAIRDFVGLSENAWDFTTPGSIPGFEAIGDSEELRRLVAHFTQGPTPATTEEADGPVAEPAQVTETSEIEPDPVASDLAAARPDRPLTDAGVPVLPHSDDAAPQYQKSEVEVVDAAPRRGHGSALPK